MAELGFCFVDGFRAADERTPMNGDDYFRVGVSDSLWELGGTHIYVLNPFFLKMVLVRIVRNPHICPYFLDNESCELNQC